VRGVNAVRILAVLALAAAPAVEAASALDQNRAAFEAFHRRDFAGSERLAREAWTLAEADKDALQSAIASANVAAAIAMRGRLEEGFEWSRRAEARLGLNGPRRLRGRILVAQAILLELQGQAEAREEAFRRAHEALGEGDWDLAFAETLAKGHDWQDLGMMGQEMTGLRNTARGSKDPKHAPLALLVTGWLDGVGGSPQAVKSFEEARAMLESGNDKAALPLVDHNLGSVLLKADRLDEAQRVYERGLKVARELSDRRMEVILLDDLSQLFSQKEDWPRAIAADREAGARLAAVAEDVRAGRLEDSLLLDLRRLVKARYTHSPQLLIDLFRGLLEQLAVQPMTPGNES